MPFVQAKCTNCGGILAADDTKDTFVCPYCNTSFIVEKAINNFNITNNIQAQTVFINYEDSSKKDFEIVSGMLKKYTGDSKDVIIPDSVVSIDRNSFSTLPIKSVFIPEGVERIESGHISIGNMGAFAECDYLSSIVLPYSMKEIGEHAFYGCTSLVSVEFKNPDTIIKSYAFQGCIKLSEIKFPLGTEFEINERAFADTLYIKKMNEERRISEENISIGLCSYCGGKFKGIFNKVCSCCNRMKNY